MSNHSGSLVCLYTTFQVVYLLYRPYRGPVLMLHLDRTTPIGKMIDSYLHSKTEMDDHSIHLLFSANRWEKACVSSPCHIGQ
jgi:thymidylate kinase